MKTSELKTTILQMFKQNELHGYEVRRKLASEGMDVDFGRLYKILNEMMNDGLLDCRWEKSTTGPNKRLCKIGERGIEEIDKTVIDAIETIHAVYGEYLAGLPQSTNIYNKISRSLKKGLKEHSTVALVVSNTSQMYTKLLSPLQKGKSDLTFYLISPKSMNIRLHGEKLTHLEGSNDSILFKDNGIDLLITGLPEKRALEKASKEWYRVISKCGRLTILAPTVLIHKKQDPLSIGDFVEKWEHVVVEKQEFVDYKILMKMLKTHFLKVNEESIVHLTMIVASEPKTL